MNTAPETKLTAPRMDRRAAIKWMLAAVATLPLAERAAFGAPAPKPAQGYGTDPDLLRDYKPGDLWPLTLSDDQRRAATALCDVIIPADAKSPSASALGVPDFIDEWISAPYPVQQIDRKIVLDGLVWLDAESQRRFGNDFASLVTSQKRELCDDIHHVPDAKKEFKTAAVFFKKFRDLTAGGFYTTKEGMKDIGYTGNVPLTSFDGPPAEVLQQLGLA